MAKLANGDRTWAPHEQVPHQMRAELSSSIMRTTVDIDDPIL